MKKLLTFIAVLSIAVTMSSGPADASWKVDKKKSQSASGKSSDGKVKAILTQQSTTIAVGKCTTSAKNFLKSGINQPIAKVERIVVRGTDGKVYGAYDGNDEERPSRMMIFSSESHSLRVNGIPKGTQVVAEVQCGYYKNAGGLRTPELGERWSGLKITTRSVTV